ncbi:U32 family peptidase [Psychrilyobacter piezotolerans]|uniref:U32 family peptidase n=1 Tax=Psychrilyobacter piezotolerans TaxID=2293438 RepID=A0ABX9KK13_9FUSO|nr:MULTISPECIES: peptidase U32 family protein [Psychrilyobacter]MCS5421437.1 U32 family peptidase [Psychrilyobacter sp. S5]NDI76581.1 U32 family peptidase [Psychrilyobacter piezotolerans]RDE65213.1 U32 family peptidase [Psychrilyobacter sp. S5]REI42831.1 U32 family peptidase [Psychrilyobacter piezotolerans]
MRKTELVAPAGNMKKLKLAFESGADSVLLGGKKYNLRTGSHNFTDEELEEAVSYAKKNSKKIWVTLDIIPHNHELEGLDEYVKYLETIGVHGVMVGDLGVFQVVREFSNLKISVLTQVSNTNFRAVRMWQKLGASRVILAREISIENVKDIREKVPEIELEIYVHGAMHMSTSGRSLLTSYMSSKEENLDSNNAQWKYSVEEQTRPGEYMPVFEDEHGTHIFHSKDLCSIENLDKILELGVDAIRIEGRMMDNYYLTASVRVYNEGINDFYSGNFDVKEEWLEDLEKASPREFTRGFYFGIEGKRSI